ncbi:MAG: rhodanese-like domain-containing protein [Saprospiraceae bacterium]|nr:rhodanese-like domain-containing protein [Saprospiraceae bacterium]
MRSLSNLFVFLLISAFFACKNDTADKKTTDTPVGPETFMTKDVKLPTESDKVKYLNADDFEKYVQNNPNIPLIDLRAPEDFAKGRIPRSLNITFVPEGFEDKVKHLKGAGEIMLYDASGIRSERAKDVLLKMNVGHIVILEKGLYSWGVAHKMLVKDRGTAKK